MWPFRRESRKVVFSEQDLDGVGKAIGWFDTKTSTTFRFAGTPHAVLYRTQKGNWINAYGYLLTPKQAYGWFVAYAKDPPSELVELFGELKQY